MVAMILLGATGPQETKEDEARSTVEPVRTDSVNAEQSAPPDWNTETMDESGQLVGLSPRVAGSFTVLTQKYAPWLAGLSSVSRNQLVNQQVASSGTAAAREEIGEFGHGSMQYAIGIEPLNPAEHFGNQMFESAPLTANEGSGMYMTPVDQDDWLTQVAQANATAASRDAYRATLYNSWFADN